MVPEDLINEEIQIDQLKRSFRGQTPLQKASQLHDAKKNILTKRKNSSFKTISSTANCLIGSACLVLPLQFASCGLALSVIVLVIVGIVSLKTCLLLLKHTDDGDGDLPQVLEKICGKEWFYIYNIANGILLTIVAMIYFLLMTNMIFNIIQTFFIFAGSSITKEFTFKEFSFQYSAIIAVVLASILVNINKLNVLIKLGHCGFMALVGYAIFIFYLFIHNLITTKAFTMPIPKNVNSPFKTITFFSSDIANVAGTFALSFMAHNVVIPIYSQNINQKNNARDLKLTYLITGIFYAFIGVFGYLGIYQAVLFSPQPNTIMDFLNIKNYAIGIPGIVMELVFTFHLCTSFPIALFLGRNQIINIWSEIDPIPKIYFYGFNGLFIVGCALMGIFNQSPGIVIAYDGAICGFLIVYLIPILIHIRTLYSKKGKSPVKINFIQDTSESHKNLINKADSEDQVFDVKSVSQEQEHSSLKKLGIYIFYGFFIIFGCGMMLIQVLQSAKVFK